MELDKEALKKLQECGMRVEECAEAIVNVSIAAAEGHMRVLEGINMQINDAILKNHEHNFVKANDGTYDKVCVICGIRAKQAVMKFKNK